MAKTSSSRRMAAILIGLALAAAGLLSPATASPAPTGSSSTPQQTPTPPASTASPAPTGSSSTPQQTPTPPASTASPAPTGSSSTPQQTPTPPADAHYIPAGCNTPPPKATGTLYAQCFATIWTPNTNQVTPNDSVPPPAALGPADIQDAYHLPSAGQGQTVAIVDAFGDSHAEADLAVFRSQFGLPPCTTANGCLRIVDEHGGTNLPADNPGWALETSLDLDAVSSACPACNILLVQGDSASIDDLGTADETAVSMGATAVSNSYGIQGEDPTEASFDHYYDHKGVAVTFSSGDAGNVPNWPASDPNVTAVGGTKLTKDTSTPRGWDETVWGDGVTGDSGGGSGCSAYEPHPDYQNGYTTDCALRATADVSADADPASGLAVYDTLTGGDNCQPWCQVGGTSLASPLVAAMYALAGSPQPDTYPVTNAYHDANQATDLFDVTSGANGGCGNLLCQAGPGWDGPTGLGTPNGVAALTGGPHGTITGQVTDAATGKPIPDVTVSAAPGKYTTTTDANGDYAFSGVLAGSYQLTAGGVYGYQDQTLAVNVTANQTTTQEFALAPLPTEAVSGTITDGSGHGWPLYAQVSSDDGAGHTATAFTDPATGKYTLRLLPTADYSLHISAIYPGYRPIDKTISVGTSDLTQDASLTIDPVACAAPGYSPSDAGLDESFDATTAPRGWQVTNTDLHYPGYTDTPGWQFTNPGKRTNSTGGTGNFAIVDSDHDGQLHYQDTSLTSPIVNMAAATSPVLQFATDLQPAVNSTATVELSTDGGKTWTDVWTKKAFPGSPGPTTVAIALPQAAGKKTVQIGFQYLGSWSQYWEIDNIFVGQRTCTTQTGGLLLGQVNDPTGTGIPTATVASVANPDETTMTVPTPDDPNLGDGFYWLFNTATGTQQFTAAKPGYTTTSGTTTISAGQVSTLNLTLTPSTSQTQVPGGQQRHNR